MLSLRCASQRLQLKSTSKQKYKPTFIQHHENSAAVCVHRDFSEHSRWLSCSCVTLRSGPCLTTPCLYVLHPVNWHLRITYPSFCASWLPDGFVQWKTLSRAQGQEREDRQVCSNHSFRLGLWQRLWLLRGACACQAASPLRVQFPRASQALCPTVLGFP